MTLFRQLLLYAFVLLTCLCIGLWMGELKRTRDFLQKQLESHAQDTATSLGLSLSTLTDGNDEPAMEAMINALFDRGYYRLVQLSDTDGNILVHRQQNLTIDHVPAWFVQHVSLQAPQAEALVMEGWKRIGSVQVESHPGFAYVMLWQAVKTTASWFMLTGVLVVAVGGIGLRGLLRPLEKVEQQAQALSDRQFHLQKKIPHTRELKRVVLAMNRMTSRIQAMFNEQTAIADSLLQRTYQDTLTSVGNRRYLEGQIKTKLEGRGVETKGVFFLIQINQLQSVNINLGYQGGDHLLKQAASIIRQACHQLPEAAISRLSGGDFALLLPNTEEKTAMAIIETILQDLQRETSATSATLEDIAYGSGVFYDRAVSFSELLARADTALATARYNNNRQAVIIPLADNPDTLSVTRTAWKELLTHILDTRSIALYSQPTVSHQNRELVIHHEILTRLIDPSGRLWSVGMFVPMAERLGLMPALDRMIIEKLMEEPLHRLKPQQLTINLSPLSLQDENFYSWIVGQLGSFSEHGLRLNFEIPEFRTHRYSDLIKKFSNTIRKMGHGIGIDHLGQGLVHFGYLKSLLPDYVKIDRALINELHNEQSDSYFFIHSLCNVAHSLDIKVIVEGIEKEQQWQTLSAIHLDAVQGFYFRQPQPLAEICRN